MGGNGVVGGGPAQPILVGVEGWPPGVPSANEPRPARLARSAAKRAEAERGTFSGGVPGPAIRLSALMFLILSRLTHQQNFLVAS